MFPVASCYYSTIVLFPYTNIYIIFLDNLVIYVHNSTTLILALITFGPKMFSTTITIFTKYIYNLYII